MAHVYRFVGWNRQKRIYDWTLAGFVVLYLAVFIGVSAWLRPQATAETLLLRALGTGAFLLLHVVLSIGPLSRLDERFLPLLYNRRHLGVATFLLAAGHGGLALVQFHAFGDREPLVSLLSSNGGFEGLALFPFQILGAVALAVLFLMAATSHDFWLVQLTPPVWKALHMAVYPVYGLVVAHVALGALQAERSPWLVGTLGAGVLWVAGLHLLTGWRERRTDREAGGLDAEGWLPVCRVGDIPEKRAVIVTAAGERVAVFRYDGKVSAISNVCQHQNGPLGEGRVIDGCVTCPWHGFQYDPAGGASPPPFTEKVPTFRVRVVGGVVGLDPRPLPAGTRVEPARVEEATP